MPYIAVDTLNRIKRQRVKMEKVLFIGSKQLGLDCLKTMARLSRETLIGVMTFDDSSDTRSKFDDFKDFCAAEEIPLLIAKNRSDSERIIEEQNPDVCFVVGWYWLISNKILESVPNGLLGIHNSLLPKYRGGSPLIWGIINDEPYIGFSMFTFTEGMDEGDIWFQYKLKLEDKHNINDVLVEFEKEAVRQLENSYLKILNGALKPVPQNHAEATYCAQRKPEDGVIDWNKPAREIFNFIRAQSRPYPGAYTVHKGKKLTIWKASLNDHTYYGTAGQVAKIATEGVTVICGDNKSIVLEEVHYEDQDCHSTDVIKTFKTRFGHRMLHHEFIAYLEKPEIKQKLKEYLDLN